MSPEPNPMERAAQRTGRGLIVPMVTPFTPDGEDLDKTALRKLVSFLADSGVDGVISSGTTGEFPLLREEERRLAVETVVEAAAGRIAVVAQTGMATTAATIAMTRFARQAGADAALVVSPYYYRVSDTALIEHYRRVADAAEDMPVFLYNIPGNTGNNLSPAVVAQLARHCPNIAGIKDSSGDLIQLAEYIAGAERRFYTLEGNDRLILAALANGADGSASGNAGVVPEPFVELFRAFRAGDLPGALRAQQRATEVARILGDGDLGLFKGVLKRRGIDVGPMRRPLLTAAADRVDAAAGELAALGIHMDGRG
jgi:4-hydroxy-tetrahydrodipicolinate synthase